MIPLRKLIDYSTKKGKAQGIFDQGCTQDIQKDFDELTVMYNDVSNMRDKLEIH